VDGLPHPKSARKELEKKHQIRGEGMFTYYRGPKLWGGEFLPVYRRKERTFGHVDEEQDAGLYFAVKEVNQILPERSNIDI